MAKGRTAPPPAPPQLAFEIPDITAPGFLRRQRDAMHYREALRTNPSGKSMDDMITFLLQFVTAPTDRDSARELLLDLSREDYTKLLTAINAEDSDFLPTSRPSA